MLVPTAAPEVHFQPRDSRSGDWVAVDEPLRPPTFNDSIARCHKGTQIQLFLAPDDDAPIDRTSERAVVRVITLVDDLVPAALDLVDAWSWLDHHSFGDHPCERSSAAELFADMLPLRSRCQLLGSSIER